MNTLLVGGRYALQMTQPGFCSPVVSRHDNGHAPDGISAPYHRDRASANAYLTAQHPEKGTVSLPDDHDILPGQLVQMGASGTFFYLKASYSFGRQATCSPTSVRTLSGLRKRSPRFARNGGFFCEGRSTVRFWQGIYFATLRLV